MLLKSELLDIEDLILLALQDAAGIAGPTLPPDLFRLRNLCEKARNNWTTRIFSAAKDHVISRYVLFHQAGITQLSDRVDRANPALPAAGKSLFIQEMLAELEQLIQFLRERCYRFFDLDYRVSAYTVRQEKLVIAAYLDQIAASATRGAAPELLSLLCADVEDYLADGQVSGLSYRRLAKIDGLLTLVLDELNRGDAATTERLVLILFKRNLNSHRFANWLRRHYQNRAGEPENRIAREADALFDIYVNPDDRFIRELPSIDEQILPWLRLQVTDAATDPLAAYPGTDEQMRLVLSVPQFAMFVRVFHKNGCFPEQNAAAIMRFFIRHFTSKKQGRISIKSFNHAFYSKDQFTAAVVLDYLQRMVAYVHKVYFPK
ncbi:hypothetical protein MTO98_30585 [Mucilaginibacter sp. SMC90]|uniref:hypothetical protein n=1 Tax=Mucilaginibacter sp. SMC90 TaxID=2929803 RepID=UPI001FB392D6|nr:hypothetical protein [Mucilaginibacter sp. SMC90]UOE48749.1 hypothetical protein MTO98_30585 [Mucilaginibacter sp. SMC90]